MRRRLCPLLHCLLLFLPVGCTAAPSEGSGGAGATVRDADADGIRDEDEGRADAVDSDGDGQPDYLDTDSDNNGRPDAIEGDGDSDGDGVPDRADLDDDGDGLPDRVELGADPSHPPDTDGDTLPDFRDPDADGDGIRDGFERDLDPDFDGLPAYRDLDSDGDCRPDSVERGDGDPARAPLDSDGDGGGDFLDLDSDNDGLLDALEDADCDGVLDPGESSVASADTDEDGVTDLVEAAAGTDPDDDLDNPQANGDFVFIMPYRAAPDPAQDTLDFSTSISQADVVFAMDTTASMDGEIRNLTEALQGMIEELAAAIPSIGIGVTQYRDFPKSPYGVAGDEPFVLEHRVMSVSSLEGRASVQSAVDRLVAEGGNDTPESGWEALYQIATGEGTTEGSARVPAFDPATAPPSVIPVGESVGLLGGVGFRAGSLPIVVMITDVPNHNGTIPAYRYPDIASPDHGEALRAMTRLGGRVIGVVTTEDEGDEARADLTAGVLATGSVVPPTAWGPAAVRPAACAEGACCTGTNGGGVPAVNDKCPLVFRVSEDGDGLNHAIVRAIEVLTTYVSLDVSAAAEDDDGDSIDAVSAFIDGIVANNGAPAPCAAGLRVVDRNQDGVVDTYPNVFPGPTVCFDVIPRENVSVPPTTAPQVFTANIAVTGDGVATLSTRRVFFLVPPEIPEPPVIK
ncbi:VWA domain-containing protein [Sorangium sp. So ce1036]|uniref:VWA domain-containing protein n=1 Tax=Sorangium sp. So ce1036 TaxID=3133328 RepID=UPI003F082160